MNFFYPTGLFEDRDTCYVLSFSVIMLNTALHNPNVAARRGRPAAITQEQFVRQNRGVDGGRDLPRDVLEMIYRSIRDEPFRIPEESYDDLMYTFFSPEREGWLVKQGGRWGRAGGGLGMLFEGILLSL